MSDDRRGMRQFLSATAGIFSAGLLGIPTAHAIGNAGVVGFSEPAYSASAPDGVAVLVVNRTGGSSGSATVTFGTANATAVAGTSYSGSIGALTWNDGDVTPKAVMVPISATGPGGAFSVDLLSSIGTGFGSIIQSTVDITPSPPPPAASGSLQLSQDQYPVTRGDGALIVTVDRVQGASGPVIATYSTEDGSAVSGVDYRATTGTLSWPDGDSSPRTFVVPISTQATAGHSFSVSLLSVAGAVLGDIVNASANITTAPTITASWSPPTANTDGTALTDLAGYYICITSASGQPGQTIQIANPATTSLTIGNLSAGTYYLTAMAYDAAGTISSPAGAVSTIVQ